MANDGIQISDIIGRHENEPAFVMGLGPSLSPHIPKLPALKENGFLLFSTNYWYKIFDDRIDYWVLANNVARIEKHWKVMNDFAKPVFYADSVDFTNKNFIRNNLTCEYLAYDERHINGAKCGSPNCCRNVIPGRLSINEELANLSGHETMYGSAGTVALHMLAFAILMKCNPIYIAGIDLNYQGKTNCYARGKKPIFDNKQIDKDAWDNTRDRIFDSFKILHESAELLGIEILNAGNHPGLDFIKKSEIIYGN